MSSAGCICSWNVFVCFSVSAKENLNNEAYFKVVSIEQMSKYFKYFLNISSFSTF